MKKGFTLVELLIVMVIVGTLITIALPKYQAAMERGRAQEAFANLKAASDILNTYFVLNGNSYDGAATALTDSGGYFVETETFTKGTRFSSPVLLSPDGGFQRIVVIREGNEYTLYAHSRVGELKEIVCEVGENGDADVCLEIGMDNVGGVYKMDLTDF